MEELSLLWILKITDDVAETTAIEGLKVHPELSAKIEVVLTPTLEQERLRWILTIAVEV